MSNGGSKTNRADLRAKIALHATISPSEDKEKVAGALRNVVSGARGVESVSAATASLVTEDPKALAFVRDQLRDRHVRSAARRQLLLNRNGNVTSLMLNRQAAAARVIALCGTPDESPLGPIYLTLESDRLDEALDWLTAYAEE